MNGLTQSLELGGAALIASTLAAVTGFGGAAVLLPVLVAFYGIRDAVPILTVAQLIGNGSRVWFNRRELDYRVLSRFAVGSIPLAFVGGLVFSTAPLGTLKRLLGLLLIATVLWRRYKKGQVRKPALVEFVWIGALFSFLSALLGSVGPLMAPFFLAYGLLKGAYIGTEALATVIMHVTKLVAYHQTSLLSTPTVTRGLILGPVMIVGSYLGKRVVDRIPERVFIYLIEATLTVAGVGFVSGWL
jgi:hypothetical protein